MGKSIIMTTKTIEQNGDGKNSIIETEKGKAYRSSLPASFWKQKEKNLKEINYALDPKNNPTGMAPEYKAALLKMRDEEMNKGYTEEEINSRVKNAASQQAQREEAKKAESKGIEESYNISKTKAMKKNG